MLVFSSDWHITQAVPAARAEESWQEVMKRALLELARKSYGGSIIVAGDVFDKWNVPPSLINWVISILRGHFGFVWAIPGQHDLPYHRMDMLGRSAFWTLVEAGVVRFIDRVEHIGGYKVGVLYWGEPWSKAPECDVLVAHRYVWTEDVGAYPGAPAENCMSPRLIDVLYKETGARLMVFGDNHVPFMAKGAHATAVNCGCLVRRRRTERDISAGVWFYKERKCKWVGISCEANDCGQWRELDENVVEIDDVGGLASLAELTPDRLDFKALMRQRLDQDDVSEGVRHIVEGAMSDG